MSGSVEEIAGKLTEAQRRALLALTGEFTFSPPRISRQSIAALVFYHSDLCEREWQDGCAQCTYYRLTPLGLQVRAHLAGAQVTARNNPSPIEDGQPE